MILSGNSKLVGIIGWPVSHSLSPKLHGFWIEKYRIDGVYLPLQVRPRDFRSVLRAISNIGFIGVNVTIPYKQMAFKLSDHVDVIARRIGAVNTLIIREDGSIEGRNTDVFGFLENIRITVPDFNITISPAVIIGAGGAARAIIVGLLSNGVPKVRLINRTKSRALELAEEFGNSIEVVDWNNRNDALYGSALLVNATSLGMIGQQPLELELDLLPKNAVVADIVCTPIRTPLLTMAHKYGYRIVDGLGMLLYQACPSFFTWFNIMPEVTINLRHYMENE
ncbi:MAG: shikimate dehydrogenase [Rhodospirillaceae bacterium]|jgi:shikimate dehydrogenase|nr:shikimate dehydrogenase [Rhodospirillaceae bacterium]